MDSPDKYKSTVGFIDLLFNVLIAFAFLFFISFLLINPVAKKADIVSPAEFLVVMSWPDHLDVDMDLWVRDPADNHVGYSVRSVGIMHLDRDDLGLSNDTIQVGDLVIKVEKNQETVSIRGLLPGEYLVGVHWYTKLTTEESIPVKVEVIKVNPYSLVYTHTEIFRQRGQVIDYFPFEIKSNGQYQVLSKSSQSAVPMR